MKADEIYARVEALMPKIAARAAEAETRRTIPQQSVREFFDAGLARILMPKRFGGYALDFDVWLETARLVSKADASHGWCASIITHHAHMAAQFPHEAQEALWAEGPDVAIAASVAPALKVTPTDGGYRISGENSFFASGVNHSTWAILGGFVGDPAAHDWRFFLVPARDYSVRDTWFMSGMRGTGSNTIVTKDVFVPEGRTLKLTDLRDGSAPGAPSEESYIFSTPFFFYAPLSFVMPMLGAAQGAYEHFRNWTKTRQVARRGAAAELPSVQIGMARAAADLDAAHLLLSRAIAAPLDMKGDKSALLARSVRDFSRAKEIIVEAIDAIAAMSGTAGFADDNPIQRAWRDIHFSAMHVSLNSDINFAHFARMEFGVQPDPDQPYFVR